ncbi:hypothetical protein [Streptomyces sp. NPDC094468]|uniref:hypothetical protein n=1 Tax=Streptomyces sp. NPDC094468 TaxID=3366066 RepID=UPI003822C388
MDDRHELPPGASGAGIGGWAESYFGGAPDIEDAYFRELSEMMVGIRRAVRNKSSSQVARRAFHPEIAIGVENAELAFRKDLSPDLAAGFFTAGARLPAIVRFWRATGATAISGGSVRVRGAGLRINLPGGDSHDLILTSSPISLARDATQLVAIARIGAGPRRLIMQRMLGNFGHVETLRILRALRRATHQSTDSFQQSYWSRGAVLWGEVGPVRYRLVSSNASCATVPRGFDPYGLADGVGVLKAGAQRETHLLFFLHIQKFVNNDLTPIEDASAEWNESDSPWFAVAALIIPFQDTLAPQGREIRDRVDALDFHSWHAPEEFRPLGNLNRAYRILPCDGQW